MKTYGLDLVIADMHIHVMHRSTQTSDRVLQKIRFFDRALLTALPETINWIDKSKVGRSSAEWEWKGDKRKRAGRKNEKRERTGRTAG